MRRGGGGEAGERTVAHLGAAQELQRRLVLPQRRTERISFRRVLHVPGADADRAEAGLFMSNRVALLLKGLPAILTDQSKPPAVPGQSQVRVVLAQQQAVLGPAREHAVGLRGAEGDEGRR